MVHGLTFIFRVIGLSYFEAAIALLGDRREHLDRLRTFAGGLALIATAGLAAVAFTPLSRVWFETVSGLTPTLATFALGPIRIVAGLPALSVGLHFLRAVLVHTRRTRPITGATVAELIGVTVVLVVAIHGYDAVGAVAAALALLIGRVVGVAALVPAAARALAGRDAPHPDDGR